ncbi:unnamed protein product [Gordionus sp. m RMFG-2023]
MDKWKDVELEKMKVGGNQKFREFLEGQPDYKGSSMNLQEKYNSNAATLYRDKINYLARGNDEWDVNEAKQRIQASKKSNKETTFNNISSFSNSSYTNDSFNNNCQGDNFKSNQSFKNNNQSYGGFGSNSYGSNDSNFTQNNSSRNSAFLRENNSSLVDGAMSSINTGWSLLSNNASKILAYSSDKVVKIGSQTGQKAFQLGTNLNEILSSKDKMNETLTAHTNKFLDLTSKATNLAKSGLNEASQYLTTKYRDLNHPSYQDVDFDNYDTANSFDDNEIDSNHAFNHTNNDFRTNVKSELSNNGGSSNNKAKNSYGGIDNRTEDDDFFGGFQSFQNPVSTTNVNNAHKTNSKANNYSTSVKKNNDNWEAW